MPRKTEAQDASGLLNLLAVRKGPEGANIFGELQAMFDLITPEKLTQRRSELSAILSTRDEYGQAANLGGDFLEKPIGEGGSREAFTDADFRARELIEIWVDEIVRIQKGG